MNLSARNTSQPALFARSWQRNNYGAMFVYGSLLALMIGCGSNTTPPIKPVAPIATVEWIRSPPGKSTSLHAHSPNADLMSDLVAKTAFSLPGVFLTDLGGAAEISLPNASVNTGPATEFSVDEEGAAIELKSGEVWVYARNNHSLTVVAAGQSVEISPGSRAAFRANGKERAVVTVQKGTATVGGSKWTTGNTVRLVPGQQPDSTGVWAGEVKPVVVDASPGGRGVKAARGFGSLTARAPGTQEILSGVRLTKHEVKTSIRNGFASTQIEEEFFNDTDRVLEGTYAFSVPPDASLSRLALWVGDKLVEGEVVERKKAASIFNAIVEDTVRPRDPALLQWEKGSEFSLKIFPLPARGSRKVVLAYDQAIATTGESNYVYPLSLGADKAVTVDEVSIKVTVDEQGLAAIDSPHYAAQITGDGDHREITFSENNFAPEGDFVLRLQRHQSAGATVAKSNPDPKEPAGTPGTVAVRLVVSPPKEVTPELIRRDRAFVLDISHGQSKESIATQASVVDEMLNELDADEQFVLLACDSGCLRFPQKGLTRVSDGHLADAEGWLSQLKPSGSTDVAGALLSAAQALSESAAPQVLFFGDGDATSGELQIDSIISHARAPLEKIHADLRFLGVGRTLDERNLGILALELGGTYERVADGSATRLRAAELAQSLRAPLVRNAKITFPPGFELVYPIRLPALPLGKEILLLGRASQGVSGELTLTGTMDGKDYARTVNVSLPQDSKDEPIVGRLWGAARIEDLEAHGGDGSKSEVVKLAQQYRLMSRSTSWLVLENDAMFLSYGIARPGATPLPNNGPNQGILTALSESNVSAVLLGESIDNIASLSSVLGPSSPQRSGGLSTLGQGGGQLGDLGISGSGAGGLAAIVSPKAKINGGASVVSGDMGSGYQRVIASAKARARSCYQKGLMNDPSLAGTLGLSVQVAQGGAVTSVQMTRSSGLSSLVTACVMSTHRALLFSPLVSNAAVLQVTYTFSSEPGTPTNNDPFFPSSAPSRPVAEEPSAVTKAGTELWKTDQESVVEKLRATFAEKPGIRKHREALIRGLLSHGRFAEALTQAHAYVEADPDNANALELLSFALVLKGDSAAALAMVDALVEGKPTNRAAHLRAAQAFESAGDEVRACAHWRTAAALPPKSPELTAEAMRCRVRVWGEKDQVLSELSTLNSTNARLKKLVEEINSGQVPKYEAPMSNVGSYEADVTCADNAHCPIVAVVAPNGTVYSPWTPSAARSTGHSVAFALNESGVYRAVVVTSAEAVTEVKIRAFGAPQPFSIVPGVGQTIAESTVRIPPRVPPFWGISTMWGLPTNGCACWLLVTPPSAHREGPDYYRDETSSSQRPARARLKLLGVKG